MRTNTRKAHQALGAKVRRLRNAKGWNLKELARRATISPATLRACERGDHVTQIEKLKLIAKALGTTADRLQDDETGDPRLKNLSDEDFDIAQWFHHAPLAIKTRVWALREGKEAVAALTDQDFAMILDGWPKLNMAQKAYVLTTYRFILTNPMADTGGVDAHVATHSKTRTSSG